MAQKQGPATNASRTTDHATKVISKASIGVAYDEPHIIVAFSSKLVPSSVEQEANTDLNSTELPNSQVNGDRRGRSFNAEWEDYAQTPVIEWSLIHISTEGFSTSTVVTSLNFVS